MWKRTRPPKTEGSGTVPSPRRWSLALPVICSGGLLGLFQGSFLAWRYSFLENAALLRWLSGLGMVVAFLTMTLLIPVVVVLRRRSASWRRGELWQANWSTSSGLAAAVAAWMVGDLLLAGAAIPRMVEVSVEIAMALAIGLLVACLPPPRLFWIKVGAALTPLGMVMAAFAPAGPEPPEAGASQVPPATRAAPDIVLVTVDTLRADCLGAMGRSPSLTPSLDQIAEEGILFRRALASSPWTVPSLASLMTGLPAVRHRAGLSPGSGPTHVRSPLAGEFTTLAERFAAAGYRTLAVVANVFLSAEMGMDQGFEEIRNPLLDMMKAGMMRELPLTRVAFSLTPVETWGDPRARGMTDQALSWLEQEEEKPLFLWIHYIDPHSPYQADPDRLEILDPASLDEIPKAGEDGSVIGESFSAVHQVRSGMLWLSDADRWRLKELYERGVRYVDDELGRLFDAIRKRSRERSVITAFTADHGEEFWDHGAFEHGHDYYREVTHVPLILWAPGSLPGGLVNDDVVGLVDVGPTLLAMAGLDVPIPDSPDEGRSLIPTWMASAGEGEASEGAAPPRFSGGNLYDLPSVLVSEGPWRYILRANQVQELYHVDSDPRERHNLALQHPEVAQRFREMLEPRLATFLEGGSAELEHQISPELVKGLKSLGYVQ